jgi:hypothetical protein
MMTASYRDIPLCRMQEPCAFRLRRPLPVMLAAQEFNSRECIRNLLGQQLPGVFGEIRGLQLKFDVKSADFESFARSFVGRQAAVI